MIVTRDEAQPGDMTYIDYGDRGREWFLVVTPGPAGPCLTGFINKRKGNYGLPCGAFYRGDLPDDAAAALAVWTLKGGADGSN